MILTEKQEKKAVAWYTEHTDHVDKIVKHNMREMGGIMYPPTLNEDKNSPMLWKPQHWSWFLIKRDWI